MSIMKFGRLLQIGGTYKSRVFQIVYNENSYTDFKCITQNIIAIFDSL